MPLVWEGSPSVDSTLLRGPGALLLLYALPQAAACIVRVMCIDPSDCCCTAIGTCRRHLCWPSCSLNFNEQCSAVVFKSPTALKCHFAVHHNLQLSGL